MKTTRGWLGLLILAILLGHTEHTFAFGIGTHRLLNEKTVLASQLDGYLKSQLGLTNGILEDVADKQVIEWVRLGGAAEDEAFGIESLGAAFRSRQHFHNPLLSWDRAGLNGRCFVLVPVSGEASIRWAQDPKQGLSGQAAWADARQAFLQALTLPSKAERDAAWARTFQILGQQMHLVADLAAPAHTRNDPHCLADGFEAWASGNGRLIQDLLAAPPVRPDPAIFSLGVPINDPIAKVPIARLGDSDQYNGGNPDVTLSPTIGLAEYSNANFFSDDTVFSLDLPFPAPTSVELGSPEPEPKTGELRRYFKKVRDGEPINHLAVPSALYDVLPEALQAEKKGLDDMVFQDYGKKLLPRAVGYSAALLDYFFRGSLAAWARADTGKVVLDLSNKSNEVMEGVFEVYAIYDKDTDGERRVKLASLEGGAVTTLQAGSFQTFEIDVPSGQALTHHYILVFRGRLGEEVDTVVGRLFLLTPRVLFVQQDSLTDIKLVECSQAAWDEVEIGARASCLWTTANRQISGTLVKNVVDPIVKRVVARVGVDAASTVSATVWERLGREPDPVAMTFTAPDSPFFWGQAALFLDIQLTNGGTISTRLATFGVGVSGHQKDLFGAYDRNEVVSGKNAYLAISRDLSRDKAISIAGYTNPTNISTGQGYLMVNSGGYSEAVLLVFQAYPSYTAAKTVFDAIQLQEGLPIKWEAVIERVYYREEAEFLRAFMLDAPPQFTIHLSGP